MIIFIIKMAKLKYTGKYHTSLLIDGDLEKTHIEPNQVIDVPDEQVKSVTSMYKSFELQAEEAGEEEYPTKKTRRKRK